MGKSQYRFLVDPAKTAFAGGSALMMLMIAVGMLYIGRAESAVVFAFLSIPFLYITSIYAQIITINAEGVTRSFPFRKTRFIRWKDAREVGIMGTKVFNRDNPKKAGNIYIYFSEMPMTDEERFDMMLNWPPRQDGRLFFFYTKERLADMRWFFDADFAKYNIGDLEL